MAENVNDEVISLSDEDLASITGGTAGDAMAFLKHVAEKRGLQVPDMNDAAAVTSFIKQHFDSNVAAAFQVLQKR